MRMRPFDVVIAALAATVTLVAPAGAATVVNGGFETGNFSGWTVQHQGAREGDRRLDARSRRPRAVNPESRRVAPGEQRPAPPYWCGRRCTRSWRMAEPESTEQLAARIEAALAANDVNAMADLLDPNVRWGAPDDPTPSCQNRRQVLEWFQRGRDAGVHAQVTEVSAHGDHVLVGLQVSGNPAAAAEGEAVERWQVMTVDRGRVVDIRAFDARDEALARVTATG
jgi:ketosteroid isomerase-like protein